MQALFMLLILIVLMIFQRSVTGEKKHDQDQDHEQEDL
jgi:hypothetical protein